MTKLSMIAALLFTQACATTEEATPSAQETAYEARPLVTLPLAHGGSLEMVELAPGVIGIGESGPVGQDPMLRGLDLDPEALFEEFKPADMAMPVELQRALARRRTLNETGVIPFDDAGEWKRATPDAVPPSDGVGTTTQAVSGSAGSGSNGDRQWFIDTWCLNTSGNWAFCDMDNWGSESHTRNDVYRYECTGQTFARTATLKIEARVWYDWDTVYRYTVPTGTWMHYYTSQTGGLDYDGECSMYTKTNCTPFDYACLINAPKAGFNMAGEGKYHSTL